MHVAIRALAGGEADNLSSQPTTITKINPRRDVNHGVGVIAFVASVVLAYSIPHNRHYTERAASPQRNTSTSN